jgi:hypothetical protein
MGDPTKRGLRAVDAPVDCDPDAAASAMVGVSRGPVAADGWLLALGPGLHAHDHPSLPVGEPPVEGLAQAVP